MTKDLVGPWVRRFLIEYVMVERNYSSNTQHSYRDMFRLFLLYSCRLRGRRECKRWHRMMGPSASCCP